jgi:hypothetical protein
VISSSDASVAVEAAPRGSIADAAAAAAVKAAGKFEFGAAGLMALSSRDERGEWNLPHCNNSSNQQ